MSYENEIKLAALAKDCPIIYNLTRSLRHNADYHEDIMVSVLLQMSAAIKAQQKMLETIMENMPLAMTVRGGGV
jgi:uncharacterized protein (UPF0332 family)